MGYTPKHAKPVSAKDPALSSRASAGVTAPSTGRHAAPESTARRERGLQAAMRGGRKGERRRPAGLRWD